MKSNAARDCATTRFHAFDARLADEAACDGLAELLFAPHRVTDVSKVKTEQKNGNDFMLELLNHDGSFSEPIRCENKFETYATGRVTFEAVSVDRNLTPGWMFTSKTAWLLSWFAKSGDLLALPMDDLRNLVMANWGRHASTTAFNKGYLSWSALEDINYVLESIPNARALDLRYEFGAKTERASMLRTAGARAKRCTSDELTRLMRTLPTSSTPRQVTPEALVDIMRQLAPVNLKGKQEQHVRHIKSLPWGL